MNNFITVMISVLFSMYFISVVVEVYRQRNIKDVDFDMLNPTNEVRESQETFERANGHEWDLVEYSERPFIPTSKNYNIELEISETNKHQIK